MSGRLPTGVFSSVGGIYVLGCLFTLTQFIACLSVCIYLPGDDWLSRPRAPVDESRSRVWCIIPVVSVLIVYCMPRRLLSVWAQTLRCALQPWDLLISYNEFSNWHTCGIALHGNTISELQPERHLPYGITQCYLPLGPARLSQLTAPFQVRIRVNPRPPPPSTFLFFLPFTSFHSFFPFLPLSCLGWMPKPGHKTWVIVPQGILIPTLFCKLYISRFVFESVLRADRRASLWHRCKKRSKKNKKNVKKRKKRGKNKNV